MSEGAFERYKTRLVGDGKSQREGINCDETFSPVVKPASIRIVLSIALSLSWSIHQLDVKNAFFHGHLNETVYIHQPLGFRDPTRLDHVCLLKKSFYVLKQVPRAWYQWFADFVTTIGFRNSIFDNSLFIYFHGSNIAYLLLYVDDIILIASSVLLRQSIISKLSSEFAMKDLGLSVTSWALLFLVLLQVYFSLKPNMLLKFWIKMPCLNANLLLILLLHLANFVLMLGLH